MSSVPFNLTHFVMEMVLTRANETGIKEQIMKNSSSYELVELLCASSTWRAESPETKRSPGTESNEESICDKHQNT